jgi:antitoxin YqcF
MPDVSEANKIVARRVAKAFGRRPKITTMWDADNGSSVDVAAAVDSPEKGLTSYSTVNLSDWPLHVDGRIHETRIEMMGTAPSDKELFESAVSTAAFCVIKQKWECYPGAIFPDILAMYHLSKTMKHVLFTEPFPDSPLDKSLQLPDRLVSWLMMVPIADSEYELAKARGWEALGQIFEDRDIDVWDLERQPVV